MSTEGTNMEKPNRNDPVSALAIRAIVAKGYCTQEQANECFSLVCDALEAEAVQMDVEFPWVTRNHSPEHERALFEVWWTDRVKQQPFALYAEAAWRAWQARAAL